VCGGTHATHAGHLGEDTVEHTAHHMPIIVEELLCAAACTGAGQSVDVDEVAGILREGIRAFDEAIARDVLDLFPGGLAGLWRLPDAYVSRVVNDAGGENYRKVKLCMYGTTALLALVDPAREHLWTANLGDCQGGALWVLWLTCLAALIAVSACQVRWKGRNGHGGADQGA
jgi:pyruvate dehydrogenase phosphatase